MKNHLNYKFLLYTNGSNTPLVKDKRNTTDIKFTFSRVSEGKTLLTAERPIFDANTIINFSNVVEPQSIANSPQIFAYVNDSETIMIETKIFTEGNWAHSDNVLYATPFEILLPIVLVQQTI